MVLYALLSPSSHNCLAGWWGKVGTIKQDEYESPPPPWFTRGPQAGLDERLLHSFFSLLQSAGRWINALARGCQRDEERDEDSEHRDINRNLSISFHLTVFKHSASSHAASMWAEPSGTPNDLSRY